MKIYGDYHTHSEFSRDASKEATVDAIVRAAKEVGLHEIAITDHGHAAFSGVRTKHFPQIKALVEKAEREHGIKVFFGTEANVTGSDGSIDLAEENRRDMDIVLCGFHPGAKSKNLKQFFTFVIPNYIWMFLRFIPRGRKAKNTEIMKRVIEKNDIDIWVHPNSYYKVNVVEVAKTCAERGTLLELNGKRISFRPIDFERALAVGAKFVISSDAHDPKHVGRTERAEEFLKYCDYKDGDIVNLHGPFRRGQANLLASIEAKHDEEEASVAPSGDRAWKKQKAKEKKAAKEESKKAKKEAKEQRKREKVINRKSD
ncbi:MAG: PHP domain-containing protein [Firmicutes bacterium]|nr:PHP domain-containing protein [Bacillota bacterium]